MQPRNKDQHFLHSARASLTFQAFKKHTQLKQRHAGIKICNSMECLALFILSLSQKFNKQFGTYCLERVDIQCSCFILNVVNARSH